MPDLKRVLNEEMHRIARKELKAALSPLSLKISEMRKIISTQAKEIQRLQKCCPAPQEVAEPVPVSEDVKKLRLTKERIAKLRTKLGLTHTEFAKLLGVSLSSSCNWESGKSVPMPAQKQRIAAVRDMKKVDLEKLMQEKGVVPKKAEQKSEQESSDVPFDANSLKTFREMHQLSKAKLATLLSANAISITRWESGKIEPRAAQKAKIAALLALTPEEISTLLLQTVVKFKDGETSISTSIGEPE